MVKNILFISDISTKFKALIDLAEHFNSNKINNSFFYFDDFNNEIGNEPQICSQKNIPYFFSYRCKENNFKISSSVLVEKAGFFKKAYSFLIFKLKPYLKTWDKVKDYNHQIKLAERFLKENNIHVVVNCEDNYGISLIFIKAAKNLKIKSVIIPFTIANKEEMGYAFYGLKETHIKSLKKKIFYLVFNNWRIIHKNIKLSFLEPFDIIAQKLTGIAPYYPFISVGGRSDIKLFESQFMLDYYIHSGFVKKKSSIVIGSLKWDVLFDANKNIVEKKQDLKQVLNLSENKPIILCSLLPDYYPTPLYKNHREIIEHWLTVLSKIKTHHVCLSLHPRTKPSEMDYIKNYSVHIVDKPIEQLIPLCDFFVASLSATIRFAIACNKPVINFDTVNVRYSEYKNIDLVKTVYTKEDFEKEIENAVSNPKSHIISNDYFGKLDGKSTEKITQIFDSL